MSRNKLSAADACAIALRADRGEALAAIAADYPQVSKVAVHYVITGKTLARFTGRPQRSKRGSHRANAYGYEFGDAA